MFSTFYLFGYMMVCSVSANFPSIQPHQKKSHFKVQSPYKVSGIPSLDATTMNYFIFL
jgi:hypothetical protein